VPYCSLLEGCGYEVGDAGILWQQYNFMTQSAPSFEFKSANIFQARMNLKINGD